MSAPALLAAGVMHRRLAPRPNFFRYRVYYLAFELGALDDGTLAAHVAVDRFAWHSFHRRDHGYRDGGCLRAWAEDALAACSLPRYGHITLICMPRVLGYVFNPVSFWACRDEEGALRAVIYEVNNTFGESHSYVCAHPDNRPIGPGDELAAAKLFHVSPFLERRGDYRFGFELDARRLAVRIDHFIDGKKVLATAVAGKLAPLSSKALRRAIWRQPLVTFKVIGLIHYQALRLLLKGVRHVAKPAQLAQRRSVSSGSAAPANPDRSIEAEEGAKPKISALGGQQP